MHPVRFFILASMARGTQRVGQRLGIVIRVCGCKMLKSQSLFGTAYRARER
jgi:hypothetical protein